MKIVIGADIVPTKETEELFIAQDVRGLFGDICDIIEKADNAHEVILKFDNVRTMHYCTVFKIKKFKVKKDFPMDMQLAKQPDRIQLHKFVNQEKRKSTIL